MDNIEESELYDRQIRLWGLDAQRRIQQSRMLVYGLGGLGAEISKNLLLAGISGTVADCKLTQAEDLSSNFFLDIGDVGVNRAEASLPKLQELNAHVSVSCLTESIENISEDIIKEHALVILTGVSMAEQLRIDSICRANGIAFFSADAMGYEALLFVDLGPSHKYRTETGSGENVKLSDEIEMICPSLQDASTMPWATWLNQRFGFLSRPYVHSRIILEFRSKNGRYPTETETEQVFQLGQQMLQHEQVNFKDRQFSMEEARALILTAQTEIAPVCAILGGVLGQEVVKYISCKGEAPISNFFALDAVSGEGKVFRAPPL